MSLIEELKEIIEWEEEMCPNTDDEQNRDDVYLSVADLKKIVNSLEKQKQKKPIKSKEPRWGMGYDYYDWICPTCGRWLCPEPTRDISIHHCKCGQQLDWNEVE